MPGFTEEQVLFEDTLVKAISKTSPPEKVAKLDAAKRFDGDLYATLAQLGVWGLGVDEEFGGSGGTNIEQLIALRALGNLSTSTAVFCVVQFMISRLLKDNANAAQKETWLKPLAAGECKASFCLTEAGGGTDILRAMKTRARPVAGGWALNGAKMWISGATTSQFYVVLARTSASRC
jgi:acyl-CoA dehydrogenase